MKHNHSVPVAPNETQDRPSIPNHEDQVRLFLARSVIVLIILDTLVYLITRDPWILGTTTLVGIIAIIVFKYYFTKEQEKK